MGLEDPSPGWLIHMTVGRRPLFLFMWATLWSCVGVLTTWHLACKVSDLEEGKVEVTMPFVTWGQNSHPTISVAEVKPAQFRRGLHKGWGATGGCLGGQPLQEARARSGGP